MSAATKVIVVIVCAIPLILIAVYLLLVYDAMKRNEANARLGGDWVKCNDLPVCRFDCAVLIHGATASVSMNEKFVRNLSNQPDCILTDETGKLHEIYDFERKNPFCQVPGSDNACAP